VCETLYVVCQGWPCWLALVLGLKLPLAGVVFLGELHAFFKVEEWGDGGMVWHDLSYFEQLREPPRHCTILASGSISFMDEVRLRMPFHEGGFLFSVDIAFDKGSEWDLQRRYRAWSVTHAVLGLGSTTIRHADCGRVTSAIHYLCYFNIANARSGHVRCMPRTLAHVLNATDKGDNRGRFRELPAPDTIIGSCKCAPIRVDGLLRREGLYDFFHPECEIARPCVFKASGWAKGHLSLKEFCRAFDLPLMLDDPLADSASACRLVTRSVTPVVVAAIFDIIWSSRTGGVEAAAWAVERLGTKMLPNEGKEKQTGEEWSEHRSSEDQQQKAKDCNNQAPNPKCKDNPSGVTSPLGNAGLRLSATPAADHTDEVAEEVEPVHKARLDRIKREHGFCLTTRNSVPTEALWCMSHKPILR
jgi:hypothetical protein